MTPYNLFEKGGVARVMSPPKFWVLNANSSKTVKATDLKFDTHVSRDSPDKTLYIFSGRGHGRDHVTP